MHFAADDVAEACHDVLANMARPDCVSSNQSEGALDLDPNRGLAISTDNLSVTRLDHVEGPEMGGNWRLAFTNASAK